MSAATPSASQSSPAQSPNNAPQDSTNTLSKPEQVLLNYLRARGHKNAEKAFLEEVEERSSDDKEKPLSTIGEQELVQALAVYAERPSKRGENHLKDSATVMKELDAMGNSANIQSLIASIPSVGAEDILAVDPTDKEEGFRELEAWVDGSLDMYRPEFRPMLFPIFCHFYLDLIQQGFKEAAQRFHSSFSGSLSPSHSSVLHHLSTLLLPAHVQNDDVAQRFKNEKYSIRMSRSGFNLLVGWLTEGFGGEALGSGDGFVGEKGKRGRDAVMRVVNNHLGFDVTSTNPTAVSPHAWEESTGLLSTLIPQASGSKISLIDPHAYNASKGELKLGPAPISEELRVETERVLREQAVLDRDPAAQYDIQFTKSVIPAGLIAPTESDLLPHPPNFKTMDIEREVSAVRDARRAIRLDPSSLNNMDLNSPQAAPYRPRALPSICAYTLHDVTEGYANYLESSVPMF
ncbi:hypothetical protein MD484_g129, partial [Candolleomyces efflorescens]